MSREHDAIAIVLGAGTGSSKKIIVIALLAGLAIGFGVGVGAGYALGDGSCSDSTNLQMPASPSSPPNPSQQAGGGCSNKDGRDETDTMMTLLTSPPKIRLNEDSVADVESYCAVLISFASMDDASRNTMIFGTSDPINGRRLCRRTCACIQAVCETRRWWQLRRQRQRPPAACGRLD